MPEDASFRLTAAFHVVAHELTRRLREGWCPELAIGSTTLTGPWMQRKLAEGGIQVTERTAYNYVQDIVASGALKQVGRLPGQFRRRGGDWAWGRGANLYSMADLAQTVLALGRDMFGRLRLPPKPSPSPHLPVSGLFTENRRRVRAEGALTWAIRTAYPGCRDLIGWRLATVLRKAGLEQWEAEDVVARYQEAVGDRKYTRADARGSVRRAYRDARVWVEEPSETWPGPSRGPVA